MELLIISKSMNHIVLLLFLLGLELKVTTSDRGRLKFGFGDRKLRPKLGLAVYAVSKNNKRIRHGEDDNNRYPFVVCLVTSYASRTCTGSLISTTWVLSAAHCTLATHIRWGLMNVPANESNNYTKIIRRVDHPNYSDSVFLREVIVKHDITLFQTKNRINWPIGKLSSVDYQSLYGRILKYAGYGRTYPESVEDEELRLKDRLKLLQIGGGVGMKCSNYMSQRENTLSICVTAKCSKSHQIVLIGDSGGPLLYDGRIAGVLSSGYSYMPISVFTPISPYLDWIESVVNDPKI